MLYWENQMVTFIINCLLITGYALLYTWTRDAKFTSERNRRWRGVYQISLTVVFLALFHFASELRILQEHSPHGFGWTYISFQVGVLIYALYFSKSKRLFWTLAVTLLIWYWWLPGVPNWLPPYAASLLLMYGLQQLGDVLIKRWYLYYSACAIFTIPFYWANFESLEGIDVGWAWEVVTTIIIFMILWQIQYRMLQQRIRQALLLREASTDTLTKLNNFRVFNEDLGTAYEHFHRTESMYALYTFDIDHFKRINDQYGHPMGNTVLERVAVRFNGLMREINGTSKTYRTGGEEFCCILFDVNPESEHAEQVANHLREELSELQFSTRQGEQFSITVSVGEALIQDYDQNYMDIYKRADQRLYHSKNAGRNTVTVRGN
jgi:diguanylate cyclase (GGDEF)-like protein